jgi:predicted restriction endonuclease
MGLADINRQHVEAAIEEHDSLGQQKFLDKYGFSPARRYVLVHNTRRYDSKAIVGAAHQAATGTQLQASEFSGGLKTVVARLTALGFDVRDRNEPPVFGHVPGISEGATFENRAAVAAVGLHRALQAGIVGTGKTGAESIVVSGGYADEDYGTTIVYTGHGGRDSVTEKQIRDQSFEDPGNAALRTSMIEGGVVRVIRGANADSDYAPPTGYRYEGLFQVEDASSEKLGDFWFCRFRMVKLNLEPDVLTPRLPSVVSAEEAHADQPVGNLTPGRRLTTSQRTVRITKVARAVKEIHKNTCQMCGQRLVVGGRGYSEGAHIQALGAPHGGPDVLENVLCLCPNCHVLFDFGALVVQEDHSLLLNGQPHGNLRVHPNHQVDGKYLAHHREAHTRA